MEWDGRAVLVTGGSRGIGLATAQRFLDGGASVTIAGRGAEALDSAAARLGHGERVRTVAADAGTVTGCYAAVEAAVYLRHFSIAMARPATCDPWGRHPAAARHPGPGRGARLRPWP